MHEVGLLGDKGRVQAKGLKPFNQRLEDRSECPSEGPQWDAYCAGHAAYMCFLPVSDCMGTCEHMPDAYIACS